MTRALLATLLALALLDARSAAACSCPKLTRDKIIELAKTGVGCPYVWGGTCWDPAHKSSKGADCSGYVTKTWQIPSASAVTSCTPHYYNTSTYKSSSTHWSSVSRSSLLKADALVYNSGSAGHIVLFEAYTKSSGCYQVYEARGSAYGIIHRVKCPDSSYVGRRRHNLVTPPPPPPPNTAPKGKLESASCDALKGWAQDPDLAKSSISVKIYVDSTPGKTGAVAYTVKADQSRSDLCASLGSCAHGFAWTIPAKLKDGKAHTLHVYALDSAGGQNPELAGSPKTITCAAPPKPAEAGPDPTPEDAGTPRAADAGAPAPDAEPALPPAIEPDLGTSGGAYEDPNLSGDPEDLMVGGCSLAHAARGPSTLALIIAAALWLARRRRRQPR
jgi:hypothetical protein